MTASDFIENGIPVADTNTALLYAESALDWLSENTTLDITRLNFLPAGAKLFIVKYSEIMSADSTVTSESLGGMSQSFSAESRGALLYDMATEFVGKYLKPRVSFTAASNRWE